MARDKREAAYYRNMVYRGRARRRGERRALAELAVALDEAIVALQKARDILDDLDPTVPRTAAKTAAKED